MAKVWSRLVHITDRVDASVHTGSDVRIVHEYTVYRSLRAKSATHPLQGVNAWFGSSKLAVRIPSPLITDCVGGITISGYLRCNPSSVFLAPFQPSYRHEAPQPARSSVCLSTAVFRPLQSFTSPLASLLLPNTLC